MKSNIKKKDLQQAEPATPKNVPILRHLCYTEVKEEEKKERKSSLMETSKYNNPGFKGHSDKCDAAAGLVDLPHVQLLVLFQGLLELGRGEASRDAALLRFRHTHHPAGAAAARHALCGQLAHQREDNIRWPLSPGHKIKALLHTG